MRILIMTMVAVLLIILIKKNLFLRQAAIITQIQSSYSASLHTIVVIDWLFQSDLFDQSEKAFDVFEGQGAPTEVEIYEALCGLLN